MLPIKVLADNVLNLTDARYFAARGVFFICLNSERSEEAISIAEMSALADWIEGPSVVLHHHSDAYQAAVRAKLPSNGIIYRRENVLSGLEDEELSIKIVKYEVSSMEDIADTGIHGNDVVLGADYLILDLRPTGMSIDALLAQGALPILQAICAATPTLLQVEVSPESLPGIVQDIQPEGWVISGGEEDKVGVKDFEAIDDFFDALESMELTN
jgi:phosphoribosylanthranilate isomerase